MEVCKCDLYAGSPFDDHWWMVFWLHIFLDSLPLSQVGSSDMADHYLINNVNSFVVQMYFIILFIFFVIMVSTLIFIQATEL